MHLPAAVIYHFRIYLVNPFDQLRSEYFLWSSISFQHTIFQYINSYRSTPQQYSGHE